MWPEPTSMNLWVTQTVWKATPSKNNWKHITGCWLIIIEQVINALQYLCYCIIRHEDYTNSLILVVLQLYYGPFMFQVHRTRAAQNSQCEIVVSFKSYNGYCFPRLVYFYNSFWCFLICINIIKIRMQSKTFLSLILYHLTLVLLVYFII